MIRDEIEIISEEPHFLLVNKPAGLFSQAAPSVPSLEIQLAAQLKARDQHPGNPFIGLPHRLDRATSGIMLIARNRRALARFGQQFQSRKVNKYYLAMVEGEVSETVQVWDDHLLKVPDQAKVEVVSSDTQGAKLAQLRIRGLYTHQQRSLVLVQLLTGRMHQIRVQAAHRGLPVVDDRIYGGRTDSDRDPSVELDSEASRREPQALHALRLEFRHPQTARPTVGTALVPPNWFDAGQSFQKALADIVSCSQQSHAFWEELQLPV